jgi:predicted  nucleic acid-binding Zn-ribbon protein
MIMTNPEIQKLAAKLQQMKQAQIRAEAALVRINEAAEVIRTQTTQLREALYTIERGADKSHLLLDALETKVGLVDEGGKRIDEED